MQSQNTIKRALFEAALQSGRVFLTVVPTDGLELPSTCQDVVVTLEYGHDMPNPIPDLEITDAGVAATLSFHQIPVKTFVPWAAVVKMHQAGDGGFVAMFPFEVVLCRQKAVA